MKKAGAKVFVLYLIIGNSSKEILEGIYSSYEKAIEAKKEDEDRSSRDGVEVRYAIDQWTLDSDQETYRLLMEDGYQIPSSWYEKVRAQAQQSVEEDGVKF